jgi:hypothetical protein
MPHTNYKHYKTIHEKLFTNAFEVEDLGKLVAELKAKDVIFKGDIIHTPVCRMAVCLDSEGNSLLLHQLNPK